MVIVYTNIVYMSMVKMNFFDVYFKLIFSTMCDKIFTRKGGTKLINYKIDILDELKSKGYTTYILRKNKYLSETTISNIRAGKPITMNALDAICVMLRKTPEEIINFEISDNDKIKYFV